MRFERKVSGLDHVHADLEEGAVDRLDDLGLRDDEVVVAAVVLLAAEVLGGQVLRLQAGAHRAVEDQDLLFEGVEIAAVGVGTGSHAVLLKFFASDCALFLPLRSR